LFKCAVTTATKNKTKLWNVVVWVQQCPGSWFLRRDMPVFGSSFIGPVVVTFVVVVFRLFVFYMRHCLSSV